MAILVVLCASKFADCCVLKVHNLLSNNNILRVWPQYTLESIENIFNNKKYKSTKFCYIKPCHKKHMSIQHLWESLQSTSYIQAKYINIIYISFLQVAYCTKTSHIKNQSSQNICILSSVSEFSQTIFERSCDYNSILRNETFSLVIYSLFILAL